MTVNKVILVGYLGRDPEVSLAFAAIDSIAGEVEKINEQLRKMKAKKAA